MKYLNANFEVRAVKKPLSYKTPLAVTFYNLGVQFDKTQTHAELSWLQNLNFKFGALRHEKRRGLVFYTGTVLVLKCNLLEVHGYCCCMSL